jgi:tRNA A58 N-methylase Trm61
MKISLSKAKSTHNPMLIKTVLVSEGPVLEIGAGIYSTPLLHWLCKMLDRKLVTYENNPEFYKFARKFVSKDHRVSFIEDWDKMDFQTHWGVILVDHDPGSRRVIDLINFKDKADYIVIHDTDLKDPYRWEEAWPHFKYRYTWKACRPWTTVVSNFIDLSLLETR